MPQPSCNGWGIFRKPYHSAEAQGTECAIVQPTGAWEVMITLEADQCPAGLTAEGAIDTPMIVAELAQA